MCPPEKRDCWKVKERLVYKHHKIYNTQLPTKFWVTAVVDFRSRTSLTVQSLTNEVIPIPGQFFSEAWATQAAKDYIDEQESPRGSAI